jgi:intein/homing endonuclease
MYGISSSGKEALGKAVENIFDRIALEFIGNLPRFKDKKRLIISSEPHFGLSNLFVRAMGNQDPTHVEKDALKSLLESTNGYIDSLKSKTMSNVTERVDGIVKEARLQKRKLSPEEVQIVLDDEMHRAKSLLEAIVESESTKFRNVGTMMSIARVSSSIGDEDPTVFFIVVRDGATCKECLRLHLTSGGAPRLWKLSQLKQGYHKRGEDMPSAFGLHPHCFVEDTKLHTSNGLISLKELFVTGEAQEVYVDKRIKNRKIGNNQYGSDIPGITWMDRHDSGTKKLQATNVYDTGIQDCIKITLENGFSLSVSNEHEMWVDDDKNGKKIKAIELKIGDKIPLISGECGFGQDSFPELAELMGNLMGDGSVGHSTAQWNFFGNDILYGQKLYDIAKTFMWDNYNDKLTVLPVNKKYNVERATFNSPILKNIFINDFGLSKKPRRIPARLWKASKETVAAFLRGLYAADGHTEKNPAVVLTQNDLQFLKEIQLLLANFGLLSSIYKHGEECYKNITYANGDICRTKRKECWRLIIGGWEQCAIFNKEIGLGVQAKNERLNYFLSISEGENRNGSWRISRVSSIEILGKQQTYCLTEPMTNTVTANGFVTGQCRCTLTYLASGFGFDKAGKVQYIEEGFDAYEKQSV